MESRFASNADVLRRRAWLDYSTVTWYAVAASTAVIAGVLADSIVLIGFGFNSLIETAVAGVVLRRSSLSFTTKERHQTADQKFLFLFGVMFFLLSLYLLHESGSKLFYREKAEPSIYTVVFAVLAVVVAAVLAVLKLRLAKLLDSSVLRTAAKENGLDCLRSLILFLGLWLLLKEGLWWADAGAALLLIPFIIWRGWKAIENSKSSALRSQTSKLI